MDIKLDRKGNKVDLERIVKREANVIKTCCMKLNSQRTYREKGRKRRSNELAAFLANPHKVKDGNRRKNLMT